MNQPRYFSVQDFLTIEQAQQASKCKNAKEICEKVIKPNMAEINRKLGQENDPMYLAYACEHTFTILGTWQRPQT